MLDQEGTVRTLRSIDEFQVIKTTYGSANHYRFSPHIAEVMEQRDILVKIRDVSTSSKCSVARLTLSYFIPMAYTGLLT